jgi:hypothetical protein
MSYYRLISNYVQKGNRRRITITRMADDPASTLLIGNLLKRHVTCRTASPGSKGLKKRTTLSVSPGMQMGLQLSCARLNKDKIPWFAVFILVEFQP